MKSVVTGIIAGLLLQIPLAGQEIIAQTGTTAFNPYLPVYLLIVAVTMLSFRMVVSKSLAAPIVMIATCLPAAWGTKNAMPILLFGTIVLSVTVPLRLKDAR